MTPFAKPLEPTDIAYKIRHIAAEDFAEWKILWDGNNQGIDVPDLTQETWRRLNDKTFPINGLVAEKDGKLVGLLHYVEHPTTGNLKPVCYVQDVYVAPDQRRSGIGKSLLTELAKIGQKSGQWARMYWLAEPNNGPAQNLYKSLGVKLDFSLFVKPF